MKNGYPKKVYLNGEITDAPSAKISVFDRGFLFGDGIYEVMVRINGHFLYGEAHLKRLDEGLQKINIGFDSTIVVTEIPRLLKASGIGEEDCLLYIQVTRGVAPRRHAYPDAVKPTFMMYAIPTILPDINMVRASVTTSEDFRWSRCDIKTISLLGNVMANEYAAQQGRYETVLFRNGMVTEASHSNVFFVKDKVVFTHPANRFILNGITRQIVLELCAELDLEVREAGISLKMIQEMDEAFLTGTTTQIASIKQLDDHFFYRGDAVGEITKKLQVAFKDIKYRTKIKS
ncbi:MAG TPA: aminotransferase class IV [Arenibacter sp.]|nr:aminotransferase class IV [Arenibacter sp.]